MPHEQPSLARSAQQTRISVPQPLTHALMSNLRLNTNVLSLLSAPPGMCGIFCSISCNGFISPDSATKQLLQKRGPDSTGQRQVVVDASGDGSNGASTSLHATFLSTVLALRGTSIVKQPLQDEATGSALCWNGEAWSIGDAPVTGNDSQLIFEKLLATTSDTGSSETAIGAVMQLLSSIRGPYAFVFYDASHKLLYYGRDCLGRRSLLRKSTPDDTLILSSVCDNASGESWTEVEADGIYIVDLKSILSIGLPPSITHIPHRSSSSQATSQGFAFVGKFPSHCALLIEIELAIPIFQSRHSRQLVI
jgi:asparagine synthetase B (glutamine-hydrolysing)